MKIVDYYHRARRRAERRRSPWQFVLIVVGFCAWLAIWYVLLSLVWSLHVSFYPHHQFSDFWNGDQSAPSFVLSFLMLFALMPISMVCGFMVTNALFSIIDPARKTFERGGMKFSEAVSGLLKPLKWASLGIIVSVISALLLESLN